MINCINIPSESSSPIPKGTMERGYMFTGGGTVVDTANLVTITFTNTKPIGDYVTWDVSYTQDESVMAYYDTSNNALTYWAEGTFYFPVYCYQLFYDFTSLTTINGLNLVDTSRVNDMYRMFRFCESLTSLDLSNWDTTNVTNMEDMFYSCDALTSFTVGSNFTMDNAISYSSYLWNTGSNVPNYDRGYVYSSDGTWYSRSSKLPNGANTYYTYNPAA